MIVKGENRVKVLTSAGVPTAFLDALENPEMFGDFKHIIKFPDSAYHYLPTIEHSYAFLVGQTITPICDDGSESFYLHLTDGSRTRFVSCALECSDILEDFSTSFNHLLATLLIQLYEFSDLSSITELSDIGQRLGFKNAELLFSRLEQATLEGTRTTFEKDKAWRARHLPIIVGT